VRSCARKWCAVASAAVWSLYPVHVMPCARQWCAASSVAVWRACGMVARVHHALGPLEQKLRQMSVGGSVPDEDVCSRGVGAHTHGYWPHDTSRLARGFKRVQRGRARAPGSTLPPHSGLLGYLGGCVCAPVLRRGVSSHYSCTPLMSLRRMPFLLGYLHTHACIACTDRLASA
jgi:hypothetical protein